MRRTRIALLAALLLALAAAGTWFATTPPADGPGEGEVVEIMVPPGAGALAIGRQLRDEGLVRSPRLFALAARWRGVDSSLKAGRYRVKGGMSWGEILDRIAAGEVVTFPLTVPEGFTLRELAPRIAEATGVGVAEEIGRLDGVRRVNESHKEAVGRVSVTLTADSSHDVRPVIFELARSKGWALFELHQETRSLEDLFQELTTTTELE